MSDDDEIERKKSASKSKKEAMFVLGDDTNKSAADVLKLLQKRQRKSKETRLTKIIGNCNPETDVSFAITLLAKTGYLEISDEERKAPKLILKRDKHATYKVKVPNAYEMGMGMMGMTGMEGHSPIKKRKRSPDDSTSQKIKSKKAKYGEEKDQEKDAASPSSSEKENETENETELENENVLLEEPTSFSEAREKLSLKLNVSDKTKESISFEPENKNNVNMINDENKILSNLSNSPSNNVEIGGANGVQPRATGPSWPVFNNSMVIIKDTISSLEWLRLFRPNNIPMLETWKELKTDQVRNALWASISFECVFYALRNRGAYGIHVQEWDQLVPEWVHVEWGLALLDSCGLFYPSHATEPRVFLYDNYWSSNPASDAYLRDCILERKVHINPKRHFHIFNQYWEPSQPQDCPFKYSHLKFTDIPKRIVLFECKNKNSRSKMAFIKASRPRRQIIYDTICGIISY